MLNWLSRIRRLLVLFMNIPIIVSDVDSDAMVGDTLIFPVSNKLVAVGWTVENAFSLNMVLPSNKEGYIIQ